MGFFLFQSTLFLLYSLAILLSFAVHKFLLFPRIKPYFTHLSVYITIICLLVFNDLLLNFTYETISDAPMSILLLCDAVLTGALLALLVQIYSYSWSILHVLLTTVIVLASDHCRLNAHKKTSLLTNSRNDVIVLLIHLLHVLYCLLNGLRTYMHRTVALTGMCLTLYMILFEQFNIEFEIPMPMLIMHFVQSIRAFFLYSLLICVRHRTAYW